MPPQPAAKKPVTPPPAWWWCTNEDPPDPQALLSCGITGIMSDGLGYLRNHIYTQDLSLQDCDDAIRPIVQRSAPLPLGLWCSANNPAGRTFVAPKDTAARNRLLNNLGNISRVARELGVVALGFDAEDFGGQGTVYPDENGTRDLGAAVAQAYRQNYAGVPLFAFGPLSGSPPGFQKFWRGYFGVAGKGGSFFTEDSYGLAHVNVKQELRRVQQVTLCASPGLGWWPGGKAADPAAIAAAQANVQAARRVGAGLFLYHEGAMEESSRGALTQALRS